MSNIINECLELIQAVLPIEKEVFSKEILPVFTCSFLAIYSILLLTDGYYFLVFLLAGFGIGGFYFNNKDGILEIEKYKPSYTIIDNLEQFSTSEEPTKDVELFYPPLTKVVNQLLDNVMRDFVLSWWTPINEHKDPTFEKLARERLNIVFLNVQKILLNQERNDIVMSTVYGVANTLIIHMRECRALEDSELSIDHYVKENPQSPFSQLLSKEEQHRQLRVLSQTFLKRTLPAQDRDSLLLMSLLKEVLATYVFGSILDNLSDPDFLNRWIIDLLTLDNKTTNGAITSTISAAVLADNVPTLCTEQTTDYSVGQVTPPRTPEPHRSNTIVKPSMVFPKGSVLFTVMDISAPQENDQYINKSELVYIIQIERPAMEDHTGSEGGGYVITRNYTDFETLNTILHARHIKRASKLQLRLPLDQTKSWLKSSSQQKKRLPLEAVGQALEKYIDSVVQDPELGTDTILIPFLRKETRSEIGDGGTVVSFTEEFKEESMAALASLTDNTNRSTRSLFSRNSISSLRADSLDERMSVDQQENRWFSKTRAGSISSMHSNLSKNDSPTTTDEDEEPLSKRFNEEELDITTATAISPSLTPSSSPPLPSPQQQQRKENPITNKALSPMDVELLIETTYALIVEIFNLTSTNNKAWMRRSILNLLREIVRRTYTEFISEQYCDFVNQYMSPDAIVAMLNKLGDQFWPEGKWMLDGKEQSKRTDQDKEESKQLARAMLMTEVIPNPVRQLIGDQNCNTAMDRIWARCQDPQLNRVLILQVMERIIKPILG